MTMQFDSVRSIYCEEDPNVIRSYVVKINGRSIGVPVDPFNRHYQAILEWIEEGNTPAT